VIEACTIGTPAGALSVLAQGDIVVSAGFSDPRSLWLRLDRARRRAGLACDELAVRPELGKTSRLIADYLDGQLDALDGLAVDQPGTAFQHEVWTSLRAIPAGETRSYTELAATTGNRRAVRAAGTACGQNHVAPIVPCHRALRRDGSLGGYYYGLDVKRWLLGHEARSAGRPLLDHDLDPQRLR
jgi:methylated-DNA-[protein]-cysteine S-methyltransferase